MNICETEFCPKNIKASDMLLTSALSISFSNKQTNHNTTNIHQPSGHHHFLKYNFLQTLINIAIISHSLHISHGANCDQMDHDSLSSFNLSITTLSNPPLNWSYSVDCCSWEGVGCDESGRVTNLSLPSRGLSGSILPSIANLSRLRILSLPDNHLTGPIPPSLANCTQLTTLILRINSLEGELLAFDFSKFVHLRIVDLGYNKFQGGLPTTLFSCKTLEAIRLTSNRLTGQIPPEIASLQSLFFLSFSNNSLNNLSGAISILSRCKNLTTLLLSRNFYDEPFPGGNNVGLISNGFQNLRTLSLDRSRLTGQIPIWVSRLQKLEVMDLSHNNITGSVPTWMGNLPCLFLLDMSSNRLSGDFPTTLLRLPRLAFDEEKSCDGNRSFFELPVFFQPNGSSNLQYNVISNLPRGIHLGNNRMSGSIPVEIGQLKFISHLDLSNNNFSGRIPDTLSNLKNLEILDLSGNHLSGEIPGSLKDLNFLSEFSVANNDLYGPVPDGGQFNTFPRSSFDGNPGLCGGIWLRSCPDHLDTGEQDDRGEETPDHEEAIINWVGFAIGFGVSFIVVEIAAFRVFKMT